MDRRRRMRDAFAPVFSEIETQACVADRFVDTNQYRVMQATLWANVVSDPEAVGIEQEDLEALHMAVNDELERVLGPGHDLHETFRFVNSKAGEATMNELRLLPEHQDLLKYFASMILDPDGHRRWMDQIREQQQKDKR